METLTALLPIILLIGVGYILVALFLGAKKAKEKKEDIEKEKDNG